MTFTPDRNPGPKFTEEVQFEDRTVDGNPTVDGAVRLVSGDLYVKLPSGVEPLTHPVHFAIVDPTVTADSGNGFIAGQHWVNTATPSVWEAVSVGVGAAVWLDLSASASSVIVEDEGTPIGGAPHTKLNFIGGGVVASDGGGGTANVTINQVVAVAIVSVKRVGCPELIFKRDGCTLSIRSGC
jgi:hypothetical protein